MLKALASGVAVDGVEEPRYPGLYTKCGYVCLKWRTGCFRTSSAPSPAGGRDSTVLPKSTPETPAKAVAQCGNITALFRFTSTIQSLGRLTEAGVMQNLSGRDQPGPLVLIPRSLLRPCVRCDLAPGGWAAVPPGCGHVSAVLWNTLGEGIVRGRRLGVKGKDYSSCW